MMIRVLTLASIMLTALAFAPISKAEYEVNYDNLLLARLAKGIDEQKWPALAREHLRLWEANQWQKLEGDEKALEEAVKAHEKHLREQAREFDEDAPFVIRKWISFDKYDAKAGGFGLQRVVRHAVIDERNTGSIYASEVPSAFLILLANNDDFDLWKMDEAEATKFTESRMEMRKRQRQKLYVEARIDLLELQHDYQFQGVITELLLFGNMDDKKPVATLRMKGDAEKRSGQWMLADGITHQGTPVHQFQYAGYRLHEIVDPFEDAYGECQEKPDRGEYSYYLCKVDGDVRRVPVRIELDIVGGRVGEARFYRAGDWSDKQLEQITHNLRVSMGRSGNAEQWNYGPAVLKADEKALAGESEAPYLRITVEDYWSLEALEDAGVSSGSASEEAGNDRDENADDGSE